MSRRDGRAWFLLTVACWALLVPSHAFAFAPGASVRGLKTRVGVFCASYDKSCPAEPLQVAETHQEKSVARYDSASGPTVGLCYLRARYLNPDSGRFWSLDSFEGKNTDPMSLHKYLYAVANPVEFIDPSGKNAFLMEQVISQAVVKTLQAMAVVAVTYIFAKLAVDIVIAQLQQEEAKAFVAVESVTVQEAEKPKGRPRRALATRCQTARIPPLGNDAYHNAFAASLQGGISMDFAVVSQEGYSAAFDAATPFAAPSTVYEAKTRHGFLNSSSLPPNAIFRLQRQFANEALVASSCGYHFVIATDNNGGYTGLRKHFPGYDIQLKPFP